MDFHTATVSEEGRKTPSIAKSEEQIARDASEAIKTLEKLDCLDCAEMLGLTPYLKEAG